MAMSVGGAGQTSVRSSPNVVPMIDIMLVLLIIFMIVTPLIAAGFKATLPKGKNLDPRPEGDNEVILGIDEVGQVLPQRAAASRGHPGGPAPLDLRRAARGQDPLLQGGQPAQVRQDPGSGGDRPALRRPGDGRHHRAEPVGRGVFAADEDKKKEK